MPGRGVDKKSRKQRFNRQCQETDAVESEPVRPADGRSTSPPRHGPPEVSHERPNDPRLLSDEVPGTNRPGPDAQAMRQVQQPKATPLRLLYNAKRFGREGGQRPTASWRRPSFGAKRRRFGREGSQRRTASWRPAVTLVRPARRTRTCRRRPRDAAHRTAAANEQFSSSPLSSTAVPCKATSPTRRRFLGQSRGQR